MKMKREREREREKTSQLGSPSHLFVLEGFPLGH